MFGSVPGFLPSHHTLEECMMSVIGGAGSADRLHYQCSASIFTLTHLTHKMIQNASNCAVINSLSCFSHFFYPAKEQQYLGFILSNSFNYHPFAFISTSLYVLSGNNRNSLHAAFKSSLYVFLCTPLLHSSNILWFLNHVFRLFKALNSLCTSVDESGSSSNRLNVVFIWSDNHSAQLLDWCVYIYFSTNLTKYIMVWAPCSEPPWLKIWGLLFTGIS